MKYTLHKDFSEIAADAWDGLVADGICDTPFARYAYLRGWWSSMGGGEWPEAQLALISAQAGDRLLGIAPLFIAVHEGRRALLLVGSIEISDYLDLIVRPADVQAFVRGLLDFATGAPELAALPMDWYNVPESSPTTAALRAEAARRGWGHDERVYRPTPFIALDGNFEAYLASLDKKQRHEIRRKMRRASEPPNNSQFELLQDERRVEPSIEQFLELMAHDAEKARFLTPVMRGHMRVVLRWAWKEDLLWLAFLRIDGGVAAAAFNFDFKGKLWGYNSAVNREYLDLSPGWVLLGHQIRWACENGRSELDFLRGDEKYKYQFGARDRHVLRIQVYPT